MRPLAHVLFNTPQIELWPGWTLRARSNRDARSLSAAHWVLRRKRDGRFLVAVSSGSIIGLLPGWEREPGMAGALAAVPTGALHARPPARPPADLPLHALRERLQCLGIDADNYGTRSGLRLIAEPAWLAYAGLDRYRRPLWLRPAAARAWARMREAALRDDILLEAISGYRSHDYQLGIFERKQKRGLSVDEILTVNAAPGYSEHHSGCALDIGTPGEPPAEESFERTPAFTWLCAHAGNHGFHMSYPRDNPHGIVYEPWHWFHRNH